MTITIELTEEEAGHVAMLLHRGARMAGNGTDGYRLAAAVLAKLEAAEKAVPPEPGKTFGRIDEGNPW